MDIQQYFDRIGIKQGEAPTYDFLARLQSQHLCTVPFENLDVIYGRPIILRERRLLDKIVRRRRGGFCYELNGAFAWLLGQLGFSVSRISAGVYSAERDEFGPVYDHMALLVELDRSYLVDVGFGDSARQPIPLPDGQIEDVSGGYRVRLAAPGDRQLWLERLQEGTWQPQYQFTTQARRLEEYQARCDYFQNHPDSHFRQGIICTVATAYGRLSLTDQHLVKTIGSAKSKTSVNSAEEVERLLGLHYGIYFDQ